MDFCKGCGGQDTKLRKPGQLVCRECGTIDESNFEEIVCGGLEYKFRDHYSMMEMEDGNVLNNPSSSRMQLVDPSNRIALRVRDGIVIAHEILNCIPGFNQLTTSFQGDIVQIFKRIYTNTLVKWNDLKRTDKRFSCPKNQKVTICACIYCAIYAHPRRYSILPDQIINACLHTMRNDKPTANFKEKVFKFVTKLTEKGIATISKTGEYGTFNFREVFFGFLLDQKVSSSLRTQMMELFDVAKNEVWLGGKDPKNIPVAAFFHVLNCPRTACKNEEERKHLLEDSKMLLLLQTQFNVKPKMLTKCEQAFKERHKCGS